MPHVEMLSPTRSKVGAGKSKWSGFSSSGSESGCAGAALGSVVDMGPSSAGFPVALPVSGVMIISS